MAEPGFERKIKKARVFEELVTPELSFITAPARKFSHTTVRKARVFIIRRRVVLEASGIARRKHFTYLISGPVALAAALLSI